ncbi:MAG: N6-L-threonylcarbamoyladenine synthase/protein kinase Bud32 [Natronomonas sp.]|jgi:N6-L-threonylcarbamoyladenine synthase/protein kinase Bud32
MGNNVRVLGIEGTAWAASAAVYDSATDAVDIETEAYLPDSGGLHPREAAEHMAEYLPEVIERVIEHAREEYGAEPFDCVAFSRGPGLGPCLRLVGTSARAVAQRLDVPLVGVNHMVAHLEIGRHQSGFDTPVCLNASGANAHLLGYRAGRYRVLGETMDTGVGNALDKFTRHVGWSHPGGPKVEEAAKDGEYVDLPYVVKGMDFSFSGIMSAAKQEYDDGTPVEDICCGLQETIFAMLTEVSERALALTGSEELVLGGGVGQNERLREMLSSMCGQRGADFFAPENRFLRDNAGMIAVLGAKMFRAGQTVPLAESGVDSDFRPDEIEVTWRPPETTVRRDRTEFVQGAESAVTIADGTVEKHRHPRAYRHPELDDRLRRERTRREGRLLAEARRAGVSTPLVRDIDTAEMRLTIQHVGEKDLHDGLTDERTEAVAEQLARLHDAGLVHGDPTPRNVRVGDRSFLIDFGLGYYSTDPEDQAMDLHVLLGSLAGTDDDADRLRAAALDAYRRTGDDAVLDQLREIEGRGRYQ